MNLEPQNFSLSHSLDLSWDAESTSPASRAALAARAVHELPSALHGPWGLRFARCLAELESRDPFASDRAAARENPGSSDLCRAMRWELFNTLTVTGSTEAQLECFRALPKPRKEGASVRSMSSLSHALASSVCARLVNERHHDLIAELFERGFVPDLADFSVLIGQSGAVFDHVEASRWISEHFATLQRRNYDGKIDELPARFYPEEFYRCPHREWRRIVISSFEHQAEKEPLKAMGNLSALIRAASRTAGRSEEAITRLMDSTLPRDRQRARTLSSVPQAERESAETFARESREAHQSILCNLAGKDPSLAARFLMSSATAGPALEAAWSDAGLHAISASTFLWGFPTSFYSPRPSSRVWPLPGNPPPDMGDFELAYLDCAALSGAGRAQLEAEAARGARPSKGLARALDLEQVRRRFSEQECLWLASFSGNPLPPAAQRKLRI